MIHFPHPQHFVSRNHLVVIEKENFATRTAALVIPTIADNRLRHKTLQRFMLANDSVTLAVEIPIWLTPADIDALEVEHGISLIPEDGPRQALTGHIDFIQVRNGAVHILDYKPDARTNKPIAQQARPRSRYLISRPRSSAASTISIIPQKAPATA